MKCEPFVPAYFLDGTPVRPRSVDDKALDGVVLVVVDGAVLVVVDDVVVVVVEEDVLVEVVVVVVVARRVVVVVVLVVVVVVCLWSPKAFPLLPGAATAALACASSISATMRATAPRGFSCIRIAILRGQGCPGARSRAEQFNMRAC